ncbi:NAD(P)-dependent alcohol dehydrogenase [Nocardia sp. CA2R105]|nr:NAD(P)-dependent alcohol dehydrogenase [Nocardia coffeae]
MSQTLSGQVRTVRGYAALERNGPITTWEFEQREPRPEDVVFDVLFCGVCHSDLHTIGAWGQEFPLVPGHEMVGRVTAVGDQVTNVRPGDIVAVSTIIDSCGECEPCRRQMEVYCEAGPTMTYDGIDRVDGSRTRGGYADSLVAHQRFVFRVPESLDLAGAAPLLCAGITTWSPLRHWRIGPASTIGVVGIGGLGHLGVKFAHALGAHVVAFTTSPRKRDTILALGADEVVVTTDREQVAAQAGRLDFILDTVSTTYPMGPIVDTLSLDGTLCSLGIPDRFDLHPGTLAGKRRSIASSATGGTRDIHEMLEFCAQHDITADVEIISPDQINEALERLSRNDVRYRFVIDMTQR